MESTACQDKRQGKKNNTTPHTPIVRRMSVGKHHGRTLRLQNGTRIEPGNKTLIFNRRSLHNHLH
jgi:hypothetical protein